MCGSLGDTEMGNTRKLSAKDLAFEKEREKFRRSIREISKTNHMLEAKIKCLEEDMAKLDEIIVTKDTQIQQLLQYVNMDEKELIHLREYAKRMKEISELLHVLNNSTPYGSTINNMINEMKNLL